MTSEFSVAEAAFEAYLNTGGPGGYDDYPYKESFIDGFNSAVSVAGIEYEAQRARYGAVVEAADALMREFEQFKAEPHGAFGISFARWFALRDSLTALPR